MNNTEWIPWLSLAVAAISLLVALRRPAVDLRNDGVRLTADEITATLTNLRRTLWSMGRPGHEVTGQDLTRLVFEVRMAFEVHQPHLPGDGSILGREVSMAVGNYAGVPGLAWISPEVADAEISPHDTYWWEVSASYVDYAIQRVQSWRQRPSGRRPRLVRFHEWRRDEDQIH